VANGGNLTPPLFYTKKNRQGSLCLANGGLYVTAPDGTVYNEGDTFLALDSASAGVWMVQVYAWGGEGNQYAIAAGQAIRQIYLPLVVRNAGS